ncbi:hypothetical protein [uncultured Tenacibaculum sp.]|uniref:hypothetical protein n=1 Tax=uncultured Tenacibaculum sp. TaxID=174713 RepID=UPI002623CBDF|nr:hypothetical protein [uncultured Tenacibaculum sp.]
MKKSILILGKALNKKEQNQINGGNNSCKYAISIDGTLCLCIGWSPDGNGFCENNYR